MPSFYRKSHIQGFLGGMLGATFAAVLFFTIHSVTAAPTTAPPDGNPDVFTGDPEDVNDGTFTGNYGFSNWTDFESGIGLSGNTIRWEADSSPQFRFGGGAEIHGRTDFRGGRLNMGGNRIRNVGNPSSSSDVATKGYVDNKGLDINVETCRSSGYDSADCRVYCPSGTTLVGGGCSTSSYWVLTTNRPASNSWLCGAYVDHGAGGAAYNHVINGYALCAN